MANRSAEAARSAPTRPASHRWKVLGVGFAANASFAAAFSGIPTTAVLLRSGYHLNNHELGLVLGMLGLGIAVSELPWGLLTDRWGDRRVLLLGLLSTAAALAGLASFAAPSAGHVPGVATLALGLLLVGLLGGSVNGSSGRAVMAWFREGERGLAMSIRQTAVPAGGGLGALLLPALAKPKADASAGGGLGALLLPALASAFGFASAYAVLASACALTGWFAWRWLHEPEFGDAGRVASERRGSLERGSVRAGEPAHAQSPLRDVRIWRVALGAAALCVPQLAVVTFGSVFLHDCGRAGVLAISVTMAAVQAGAAVARVWSGAWTDRRGNRREYMRACSLLSAVLFALLAMLSGIASAQHAAMTGALAAMVVLGGVSASAWHGVAFTELATLAGTRRAGTALAIGNTCVFLTLFVTPLAIPPLLSIGSWAMVWAVASGCALFALPVFPRAVASRDKSAARAGDAA